jgi:hypothetical protein
MKRKVDFFDISHSEQQLEFDDFEESEDVEEEQVQLLPTKDKKLASISVISSDEESIDLDSCKECIDIDSYKESIDLDSCKEPIDIDGDDMVCINYQWKGINYKITLDKYKPLDHFYKTVTQLVKSDFYIRYNDKIIKKSLSLSSLNIVSDSLLKVELLEPEMTINLIKVNIILNLPYLNDHRYLYVNLNDKITFLLDLVCQFYKDLKRDLLICVFNNTKLYPNVTLKSFVKENQVINVEIYDRNHYKQKDILVQEDEDVEAERINIKIALLNNEKLALSFVKGIKLPELYEMVNSKSGKRVKLSFDGQVLDQSMLDDEIEDGDCLDAKYI